MQRSEVLDILTAGAGAAGAAGIQSPATPESTCATKSEWSKMATAPFIDAHDGTRLCWTQCGVGPPILFLSSAGMTTQMWDYQMVAFAAPTRQRSLRRTWDYLKLNFVV